MKKQNSFRNSPSEIPRKSSGGQHSKFFLDKRYEKLRQKIFDETYHQQLEKPVNFKAKINTKETFNIFPPIILIEDLSNIHPCLFSPRIVPSLLLAGRLNHFLEALEILTKDPEILELVKGFKISFLKNPTQKRVPQTPHMSQEQAVLIQVETENMLKNGVIQQTEHQTGEFISNIFLTRKRDGENRSE